MSFAEWRARAFDRVCDFYRDAYYGPGYYTLLIVGSALYIAGDAGALPPWVCVAFGVPAAFVCAAWDGRRGRRRPR